MAQKENNDIQPMLIFMPDISGFSKFVHDTEIAHSQHIISELLESLIDANELDMKVSEIEGDAILFYKPGPTTYIKGLLAQVEKMYTEFHAHLKKYEHTRICECGACSTANTLKLKFVVTYGEVGFNNIKGHNKLFGKEVIVAHRLLKNKIDESEYVLLTDDVTHQYGLQNADRGWNGFEAASEEYDVGTINYEFRSLEFLEDRVPFPTLESFEPNDPNTIVLNSQICLDVPIELLFNVISDYSIRHLWTVGLKDSDRLNGPITKNGSTHRCLINDNKDDPFFVAHDFRLSKDYVVFSETERSKGVTIVYSLKKIDENNTELHFNTFLNAGIFKRTIFKLFFKNKLVSDGKKSMQNLREYCHRLIQEKQLPKNQIVLPA